MDPDAEPAAEQRNQLREHDVGTFGELSQRPNPEGFVIVSIPALDEILPHLQQQLGRELTPEEIERQHRKSVAMAMSPEAAEKFKAERMERKHAGITAAAAIDIRVRPPTVKTSYSDLPSEPKARKEAAVDLFGQHLFSLRNQLFERIRRIVETPEIRERMANLQRQEYDDVASLSPDAREKALALSRTAIDGYLKQILSLLTGIGDSLAFGPYQAIIYRLVLQIKDVESDHIIEEFDINRDSKRVFYDYYGRWLNRYSDHR